MTSDPSIWLVVPAYNEGSRLAQTLSRLAARQRYEVVVVDDGSGDQTPAVAKQFPVWLLRHPFNCGQGAALQTGIDFAMQNEADIIVTFDADGQHEPADIERLIEPVLSGRVDVALGTRFGGQAVEGMPLLRRLLLTAAVWFSRLSTGLQLTDSHNGLRALSRAAAKRIRISQPRMAHASEVLDQIAQYRLSYEEVPVTVRYTADTLDKGQSTWDAFRIGGQLVMGRLVR